MNIRGSVSLSLVMVPMVKATRFMPLNRSGIRYSPKAAFEMNTKCFKFGPLLYFHYFTVLGIPKIVYKDC